MPPTAVEVDVTAVIPAWQAAEAASLAAYVLVSMLWPGRLLRQLLDWTSGVRAERFAVSLLCGIVANALVYWLLLVAGCGMPGSSIGAVHFAIMATLCAVQGVRDLRRRRMDLLRLRRRTSPYEVLGYALIALCAAYYLARTAPLFDYDGERLRLYGAAHSDKLTSVMPCAGLRYAAPPDNLRFTGYKFLTHYFPHLAAASLERSVGVNYLNSYWFHLPVLGIVVNGAAVLALARRRLKSYRAGCVAVLLYALWQATAYLKPLDVTPALVLTALLDIDRYAASRRGRWLAATVAAVGVATWYEVFHAATFVAALGLWGAWGVGVDLWRRRPVRRERVLLPSAAAIAAVAALQLANLGVRTAKTEVVPNDTFGDSYRHAWRDRASDDDAIGRTLTTLYAWNRNRAAVDDEDAPRPAWYERVVGRVTYGVGLVVYVYVRFGLWATFGFWHLWQRRAHGWRASDALVAAAACVGFGAPWLVDVGTRGGGQWWSSPNLYRVTEFAAWLTATLGAGVLVRRRAGWRRPRCWPGLVVAAAALASSFDEHKEAATYFDVPREQVETMAFLRERGAYDDVILHPWSDCSIRRVADGGEAYLQKRFYMLMSELAGRRCYCEGRAEYLFMNAAVPEAEIDRRLELRRKFYASPTAGEVDELLATGPVRWIVVDAAHRPPPPCDGWPVAFTSGDVQVLERPERR